VADEHRGLIVRPEERISVSKSMRNSATNMGQTTPSAVVALRSTLLRPFNGLENRLAKALAQLLTLN